jgi:asparagine synthase (glutamine-hydrolysing)
VRAISGSFGRFPTPSVVMSRSVVEGDVTVSFDGRIDDRNHLLAELSLSWQAGDTAIIAAAYRRWDDAFLRHIDGDFVLALWEPRRRRLLLARDCFGIHPLYYHRTPEAILWSSHLQSLVEQARCDRTPDPDFVAGFLTHGRRGDVSPYAAVASVPPAGLVCATRHGDSVRSYWSLDPAREIRMASDLDYEERFFELFRNSVRNRLTTDGPVFCELSGGVDSSSILAVADGICHAEGLPAESLQTVSEIFDETSTLDDRPFITIVEEAFGRPAHHVHEKDRPLFSSIGEDYPFDEPSPAWISSGLFASVNERMAVHHSTVLLNGAGGDSLCWSQIANPPSVADDLARLRFGRALRESRRWAPAIAKPQARILLDAVHSLFGRDDASAIPWIDRSFARANGIDRSWLDDDEVRAIRQPSRRLHFMALRSLGVEMGLRHCVAPDIDVRYPFVDRRLIDFVFAIPIDQHLRPGETRSLQHRAMARVLPHKIAYRKTKGGPAASIYRRFRQRWPAIKALFDQPRVCDYGYVDRAGLAGALQRAAHGQNTSAPGLLRLVALESWLRALERPSVAVDPRGRDAAVVIGRR